MGVASESQYRNAVRRLFPQGEYWNAQFADPQSDTSLFVQAKAAELMRFRQRMSALLDESKMETTTELIADWERVYLDVVYPNLDINQRRLQLKLKDDLKLNRAELQKIAAMFGLIIKDVNIPYRPRFFGFAKFTQERLGSFTTFSVVKITAAETGFDMKHWESIKIELESHRFTRTHFGIERLGYFPVYKMREIIYRKLRRGCFGYGRFAQNTLTPFPVDCIYFNAYIAHILQTANFYKRFERTLVDAYFTRANPYCEFETAISAKLLANQIPIFYYGGE